MIRLIASDMDGTLLDGNKNISNETIALIHKAQAEGIEFIINTGREYQNASKIVESFGITCGAICSNGASAYDIDGNLLFEHFIPDDLAKQALDILENFQLTPTLFSQHGRLSFLTKEELKQHCLNVFIPSVKLHNPEFSEADNLLHDYIKDVIYLDSMDSLFDNNHQLLKLITQSLDHDKIEAAKKELRNLEGLAVASTTPSDIEITIETAQKGIALLDYAKRYGYKPDEIVAIGDSENDYSMLSLPEVHTVAMANASEAIKEVADFYTKANTKDGIAYIIQCILADRENFKLNSDYSQ